jgi:hypothetical protein
MTWNIADATRRWLAGNEARQRSGKRLQAGLMAPWDENAYFDLPIVTALNVGIGPTQQVIGANPRRVVLMFSNPGAQVIIGTSSRIISGLEGFNVSNALAPIVFTQKDHGPLCTIEWWANFIASGQLTITEVLLREWP